MDVHIQLQDTTSQYMQSDIPEVAQASWQVQQLNEQFQAGELNRAEYEELVMDTLDLDRVVSLMESQERRQEIAQILDALKRQLGGVLSLII